LRYLRTPESYRKCLARFVRDYACYFDDIVADIAAGDLLVAARQTHKLKGIVPTLGLMELASIVVALDHALLGQQTTSILENLVAALRLTFTSSLKAIDDYLAETETTPVITAPETPAASNEEAAIGLLLQDLLNAVAQSDPNRAESILVDLAIYLSPPTLAGIGAKLEQFDFDGAAIELRLLANRLGIADI
jgi:HPt (histidine-containing phosphotransfer) domain-containing protein